jgi:hypothetical protein
MTDYKLPGIDLDKLTIQTFYDAQKLLPDEAKDNQLAKHFLYNEDRIIKLGNAGAGIYWCINPGNRKKENTTAFARIGLDIDFCKDGQLDEVEISIRKLETTQKLEALQIPPSAIIETKNGLHPYWIFDRQIALNTIEERYSFNDHEYKQLVKGLEIALGIGPTDRKDICGVFRLPGSKHLKDPTKPFEIIVTGDGHKVSLDEFMKLYLVPEEVKTSPPVDMANLSEDSVYKQPLKTMLALISGHEMVKGEKYDFTPVRSGKCNVIIDGKKTSQFINLIENTLGAKSGASVNIVNWITWYGVYNETQAREELDRLLNKWTKKDDEELKNRLVEKSKKDKNVENDEEMIFESLGELMSRDLPEECWLIDKIVPITGFCAIAGPSGVGKSFYALTMAHSIATGEPWLGEWDVPQTTNVLILDKENGPIWRKKRAAGLKMDDCTDSIFYSKKPEKFNFTDGNKKYTEEALKMVDFIKEKNIGLVVIDSFVDFVEGDENSGKDTQVFYDNLRALAPEISYISIVHFNKTQAGGDSRPLLERMAGSRNIGAQLEGGIAVDVGSEDSESVFQFVKTRNTGRSSIMHRVKMLTRIDQDTGESIVTDLVYLGISEEDLIKRDATAEIIQKMVYESGEIGVPRKTLYNACVLGNKIKKSTFGRAMTHLMKTKGYIKSQPNGIGNQKNIYFTPNGSIHYSQLSMSKSEAKNG